MTDFLSTVRATIDRYRMFRPGDRVVVAVSGGPDSLALLSALTSLRLSYRLTLRAAYVDHGLRPRATQKEAALVRQVGRLWNVPVHVLRREVKKEPGQSLEALARQVRYESLAALARRTRCRVLALGHTQDDQAETVLMWILRGTGTMGLAGIPPVRRMAPPPLGDSPLDKKSRGGLPTEGRQVPHPPQVVGVPPRGGGVDRLTLVRPLLDCSRQGVERYLKSLGLKGQEDRSNRSEAFLRNRLRRQLIPLLEREYNPQVRRHLASLAQIVRADREWMETELARQFRQVGRIRPGQVRLSRVGLTRLPWPFRIGLLRWGVQRIQGNTDGFKQLHWEALGNLLRGQGRATDLPHGFRAEVSSRWLRIFRITS